MGGNQLHSKLFKILASAACNNSSDVGRHLNQPEYQLKEKGNEA
jgi:hypothetical protein